MTDIPEDALVQSWDDVQSQSLKLANLIEQHIQKTGEVFDYIIVLPMGSYFPVNTVARHLGFDASKLLSAAITSYKPGETKRQVDFKLGQMPTKKEIESKNLLIIDEICDTGKTLDFLTDYLKQQGANTVQSGVLHYKPTSSKTGYKPDWFIVETDKWIVYPWE